MAVDTYVDVGAVLPALLGACSVLITGFIGWAAKKFKDKTNVDIEATYRDALAKAILTGLNLAANKLGTTRVDVKNEYVAIAAKWVLQSVPQAVEWFKLGNKGPDIDPKLQELIESKIPMVAPEVVNGPVYPTNPS